MGINCSSEIHCVDIESLLCALIVKVHVNKRVARERVIKVVFKIIFLNGLKVNSTSNVRKQGPPDAA